MLINHPLSSLWAPCPGFLAWQAEDSTALTVGSVLVLTPLTDSMSTISGKDLALWAPPPFKTCQKDQNMATGEMLRAYWRYHGIFMHIQYQFISTISPKLRVWWSCPQLPALIQQNQQQSPGTQIRRRRKPILGAGWEVPNISQWLMFNICFELKTMCHVGFWQQVVDQNLIADSSKLLIKTAIQGWFMMIQGS